MSESENCPFSLQQFQQRDARAFRWLVGQNQRLVLSLARSLGLAGADADDAAAEAFAAVFRALPGFQGRSKLSSWVYRIALRAMLRHRGSLDPTATVPDDAADPRQRRPDQQAETAEAHERLWVAVGRLEPKQAAAVEMYYRQGWPLDTIAEVLQCPMGTVKTMLFRAREALRKMLADEVDHR